MNDMNVRMRVCLSLSKQKVNSKPVAVHILWLITNSKLIRSDFQLLPSEYNKV